ncbi:phosphoribosylformylglycinamidine synthase [Candidatus Peregrinibacteria bacterium]|nr:phosphoribosylformylglycinamidine synthase [Candidatus Peregrinibacteria bacterium]
MAHRIEVFTKVNDTRSAIMRKKIGSMGYSIHSAKVVEVYTINKDFQNEELKEIAKILSNPISQDYIIDSCNNDIDFDFALETGFLPGVTDNVGNTAKETIEDLLKIKFNNEESVHSSTLIFLKGEELKEEYITNIGEELTNELIQRIHVKKYERYIEDKGMDVIVPKVKLEENPKTKKINLDVPEEDLKKLSKKGIKNADGSRRGPLGLDMEQLETIKEYYKKEDRKPTDVELESLAQTWSEHCKHTIFSAKIDDNKEGLYKGYIKKATREIRNKKGSKDFCVSVFKDNSGGILFNENWVITDKAETHNSPSALDPFGGAITGIVGVNRDTIGFGKGAKPIINKYGFCVGNPDDKEPIYRDKELKNKALSPKKILEGVVEGVNAGGNTSGIPTPQGFVYFNERYKGKPLVFVGTVGFIPKEIDGEPSWEKKARKGDKIVMIGGRVGQDGIHGATFSSEALTAGSPATAVQIGDPITQKKFSDAVVKEARDMDLYNSITDNGAGGLSCSVSETARESGGLIIELDKVPTKYPNLDPWEIWISESQERMTLAVPPEKLQKFIDLMEKRSVEATVIGKFTDSGRCIVQYKDKTVMDLDLDFLHEGLPQKELKTIYPKTKHPEPDIKKPEDLTKILHEMIERHNLCSYEFISSQYDHEVQGGSVLKPLQGKGKVNATASITKPFMDSKKGIVCSQGINPAYSDIDTYHMAACAIDTAIRNIIQVGGDLEHTAIMDNFCWCSSDEPERLGQLKSAAKACYDFAVAYETPFISGKDSMFNDFKGFDKKGRRIKISIPPTLLVSSLSVINDVTKSVSLDPKFFGDLIYVLGETKNELGASEYFAYLGEKSGKKAIGNSVPKVNAEKALKLYKKVSEAIDKRLIASALSPIQGGLGITLVKKAIAGQFGMEIDLSKMPKSDDLNREDYLLFSESQSRFVVTVDPKKKDKFENLFQNLPFAQIGKITDNQDFIIKGFNDSKVVKANIIQLGKSYRKTFKDF